MENTVTSEHDQSAKTKNAENRKMFDALYDHYKSDVYRFAVYLTKNRGEAEELFQDTWLRVAKNFLKAVNMKKVKSWIFTITSNLYKDSLRKKRVRRSFLFQTMEQAGNNQSPRENARSMDNLSHTDSSEQLDIGRAISQALTKLPEQHRQIFVLKEMAGFKYSEISEILKLPEGTVKSVLFRAVKKLRLDLKAYSQG
ncbi:MAG TPA: RNA polymerase sigma factor [Candidatus Aminicenantes bacterium]|nr:RNA polymerase sigma factor [Candidatus Aminicenantes bacterium]